MRSIKDGANPGYVFLPGGGRMSPEARKVLDNAIAVSRKLRAQREARDEANGRKSAGRAKLVEAPEDFSGMTLHLCPSVREKLGRKA